MHRKSFSEQALAKMSGVGLNKDVVALFMLGGCPDTDPNTRRQQPLYVRNSTVFGISVVLMGFFQALRRIEFSYNVLSQIHCV